MAMVKEFEDRRTQKNPGKKKKNVGQFIAVSEFSSHAGCIHR